MCFRVNDENYTSDGAIAGNPRIVNRITRSVGTLNLTPRFRLGIPIIILFAVTLALVTEQG